VIDYKEQIIKSVSAELQHAARQESQKAQGAVEYWTALAERAVNRTLQILKDTPNELSITANALEAIANYARGTNSPKLIGDWLNSPTRPDGTNKREPRAAGRKPSRARKPPTAKRPPARRKRSRKNP
jgi:hypothetical protein